MPKIAIIGAGSAVFSKNLFADVLAFPPLRDASFSLMDTDPGRLQLAADMCRSISDTRGARAAVQVHADRRAAIEGADYVINTIGVGGEQAIETDFRIPNQYGVRQTIADTLGVGGIFRTLRSLPVVLAMCRDIEEVAPRALLLTYTNPMATHCLGIARATAVRCVGLCHGVQHTRARMILLAELAKMDPVSRRDVLADHEPTESRCPRFWQFYHRCLVGEEFSDIRTFAAGINHMAAFLKFERGGRDLYPALRDAAGIPEIRALERVRLELMERFGYFMTETSGHIAEYLPWFLRDEAEIKRLALRPDCYLGTRGSQAAMLAEYRRKLDAGEPLIDADAPPSIEYASRIMNAVETGEPFVFNGNFHNRGGSLIGNLPGDCCVEVPALADRNGVQPTAVGDLPPQIAAMIRTNVNVQDLTVEAVLRGKREHVYHAAMLDPNTAATLPLPKIHALVDALFAAHGELIPEALRR